MRLGSTEKLREAEILFDKLTEASTEWMYWYNLAILKSQLKKWDEAVAALRVLIERYRSAFPATLEHAGFWPLKETRPQQFAELRQLAGQAPAPGLPSRLEALAGGSRPAGPIPDASPPSV